MKFNSTPIHYAYLYSTSRSIRHKSFIWHVNQTEGDPYAYDYIVQYVHTHLLRPLVVAAFGAQLCLCLFVFFFYILYFFLFCMILFVCSQTFRIDKTIISILWLRWISIFIQTPRKKVYSKQILMYDVRVFTQWREYAHGAWDEPLTHMVSGDIEPF